MCLIFFNVSCGLDVISVVLEDPVSVTNQPNKDSAFTNRSFEFSTKKLDNATDMGKGYVYYKIYSKADIENNEVTSLNTLANDTTRNNSATSLINTYNYKELNYSKDDGKNYKSVVFDNKAQNIKIRLTNYVDTSSEEFSASIKIDDKGDGVPFRINGKTFDFGRKGSNDEIPVEADDDSSNGETKWDNESTTYYVALFYVFMMYDDFYTPLYSPIHYLGTVKIDSTDENN